MDSSQLTAELAGMTFNFHGQGAAQNADWQCAPLKHFIRKAGNPHGNDCVDVSVRIGNNFTPAPDAKLVFSARMEATEDNFETEWYLYQIPPTGEEMIIQLRGSGNDIKTASIRFSAHEATLTLQPEDENQFSLIVFPLFNIFLSRLLARRGGFLIHSSVVKDIDGRGYLFTAVSGTGKSTIAHIFEGQGAALINDDMLAIRTRPDGLATAYALPMPYYAQTAVKTELSAFFVISQSPVNKLTRFGAADGVARVLANVIQQPFSRESTAATLANVIAAISPAQAYGLGFKPDAEVVNLVRSAQ